MVMSYRRWKQHFCPMGRGLVLFLVGVLLWGTVPAQWSEDPSDATASLLIGSDAGTVPALPAACVTLNGPFSMGSVTSATAPTVNLAQPSCGSFAVPPSFPTPPATSTKDIWFRLDPPVAATAFRFTLFGTGAPAMTNGAMAIYEAASATAPMRLIQCFTGGSLTSALPTMEVSCITAGNKLYVRVWDETAPSSSTANFHVCVQKQAIATMPARGAAETACAAPLIAAHANITSVGVTVVDYSFSCDEGFLQADSGYVGGDLWMRLTVPASGFVRMKVAAGSVASSRIGNVTLSAYLSTACGDPTKYRQVGTLDVIPTTWSDAAAPNFVVTCLPPGATLYIRVHSARKFQNFARIYGQLRFKWVVGVVSNPPPVNSQPCSATPLTLGAPCPGGGTAGTTEFACNIPGMPDPACGGFSGSAQDVWYTFTAPATGTVFIEGAPTAAPGAANPAMALYSTGGNGCNGRFTLVECDAAEGAGTDARIIRSGLVPGQTYYLRVWSEATNGPFTICVREPVPAASHCYYLIDLGYVGGPGSHSMNVSINAGPVVNYTPSGGDMNELFLVEVPAGASVVFTYLESGLVGGHSWGVTRLGDATRLWVNNTGSGTFGPGPGPSLNYTLNNACTPLIPPLADCLGAQTVCVNPLNNQGTLNGTIPTGNTYDLAAANMGCLPAENRGIAWLIFKPEISGTVSFWLSAQGAFATTADLDFAVWDVGPVSPTPTLPNINGDICPPQQAPVRCTSARVVGTTGLLPGVVGLNHEGTGGLGWLSPLPVVAGNGYLIAVIAANTSAAMGFNLYWSYPGYMPPGITPPGALDYCTQLILPVELILLEAEPQRSNVHLSWATGSEKNSDHFVVERSVDANDFIPIGAVPAAGFSSRRIDYSFVDQAPLPGTNYYRLQIVDQDGQTSLSNVVVAVFHGEPRSLSVFPNPAKDELRFFMYPDQGNGPLVVHVVDVMGRVVLEQSLVALNEPITVGHLMAGAYLVSVSDATDQVLGAVRFVKE